MSIKPNGTYEERFLSCAAFMIVCRWLVMGHWISKVPAYASSKDLAMQLLGMIDNEWEMELILKEWRNAKSSDHRS